VESPFAEAIQSANQSAAFILSVDVPSGLDCDLGTPCGVAIRANATVTFVAQKPGFLKPGADEYTGAVEICHIGIPQIWLENVRQRGHTTPP
jgi:NAD(P)H-hydrate repair Nnr-like enzyme with NAD(P)H-hydrate epimerase domain